MGCILISNERLFLSPSLPGLCHLISVTVAFPVSLSVLSLSVQSIITRFRSRATSRAHALSLYLYLSTSISLPLAPTLRKRTSTRAHSLTLPSTHTDTLAGLARTHTHTHLPIQRQTKVALQVAPLGVTYSVMLYSSNFALGLLSVPMVSGETCVCVRCCLRPSLLSTSISLPLSCLLYTSPSPRD